MLYIVKTDLKEKILNISGSFIIITQEAGKHFVKPSDEMNMILKFSTLFNFEKQTFEKNVLHSHL